MERQNTPHPKKAGVGFADEDDENAGANNDEKKAVSPVASRRKTPFPKKVGVAAFDTIMFSLGRSQRDLHDGSLLGEMWKQVS